MELSRCGRSPLLCMALHCGQHSGAAHEAHGDVTELRELAGAQARCTERMNLWQSCENSAATLAASSAPRRLATEAASQPVTAALAASSACRALQLPYLCWSYWVAGVVVVSVDPHT